MVPLRSRLQRRASWNVPPLVCHYIILDFITPSECAWKHQSIFSCFLPFWNSKALMVPPCSYSLIRLLYAPTSQPGENRTSHSEGEIEYWIQLDANRNTRARVRAAALSLCNNVKDPSLRKPNGSSAEELQETSVSVLLCRAPVYGWKYLERFNKSYSRGDVLSDLTKCEIALAK